MNNEESEIDVFSDSLERCQTNPHFLSLFYRKFVISNAEVRQKFANTDMKRQKQMLHASIYMIMQSKQGHQAASSYMENVARRHSHADLDIRPELYDLWLETLIETVKEMDFIFDEKIEKAWRSVLSHGVEFMKSRYDQ